MKTIFFLALMLFVSTGHALTVEADGSTKFIIRVVLPTCNVDFDPVLALPPVPLAKNVIEHSPITLSVVCNTSTLQPWLRLTQNDPVVDSYKVRMSPNQLLLSFKDKDSQKYVIYNSTDPSVSDTSMTGMLGGQSHNYQVELIPVTEVDSISTVKPTNGTSQVGVELYYK
ncbi:hypothetical protein PVS06_004229 [Escherichia coli]|nr:hypothetical protein [Escherichia coli]EJE0548314.1 hypothetical protein [Escherichia coli]EKM8863401.1 hypothetical protein [Escherichia coli]